MGRCRNGSVGLTPRVVDQRQMRNLLFQDDSRLPQVCLHQAAAHLIVEEVEIGGYFAAFFAIKRPLQLSNHFKGVVDFPRADLNIIPLHCCQRTPKIVDTLLVEENHQLQGPCASCRCLAI